MALDFIIGHNDFDNTVFGGKLSALAKNMYVDVTAKLISNGSKNEDYFKAEVIIKKAPWTQVVTGSFIKFTPQSSATNPTADVASTLVLTMTDAFGHENVYKLPFTVKRAE